MTVAVAYLVTRERTAHYELVFTNAGQLVKGDLVRIGGTRVGSVTEIRLSPDYRARVAISVDRAYAPLHRGTTATVRQQSLTGVASRYVDVSPGPSSWPEIPDGATIDGEHTTSIVEIDQLFDTLDERTRSGLRRVIDGSATWYDGRERQANASTEALPVAVLALTQLAQQVGGDDQAFEQFLVQTGDAMEPLAQRSDELADLVANARTTASALGSDTASLSQALEQIPPALRAGSDAFVALRPALVDLRHLTDVAGPATKDLTPFLRQLRPVVTEAVPVFHQLRTMFAQPGPSNDALDALRDLPPLAASIHKTFPNARKALHDSTPVIGYARPYTPHLIGWVHSFGSTTAPYDANGHYARTSVDFDAFSFTDDGAGGLLAPKAPPDRGTGDALATGNLRRCPGTATLAPTDGSAPFVDDGLFANADCDPSQRVGSAP